MSTNAPSTRRGAKPLAATLTETIYRCRYASYSRRATALTLDSIRWTVVVLLVPLGPSTEEILVAPESYVSTIVLWCAIGQCVPILLTGLMWARRQENEHYIQQMPTPDIQ
jgi:hypothetical protein